jgi:hypothetical protein
MDITCGAECHEASDADASEAAPSDGEEEITEEMIKAGVQVLERWERDDGSMLVLSPEALVIEVYSAMAGACSPQVAASD